MIVDVKERLLDQTILDILAHSQYMPTPEKMRALAKRYGEDIGIEAYGWSEEDAVCGVAVIQPIDEQTIEIVSIAVNPATQNKGIGRKLIEGIGEKHPGKTIVAETDDDAVGFYERCGFAVESAVPRGGYRRYRCALTR